MEFDIFTFMIGCALGVLVGYRVADHIHKAVIADLLERAGVTPEKMEQIMRDLQKEMEPESTTSEELPGLEITIEQHSNTLLSLIHI